MSSAIRRGGSDGPEQTIRSPEALVPRAVAVNQEPGGYHATDRAEQGPLPGDPLLAGQDAPEQAAVHHQDHHAEQDLADTAGEDPAHDQVGQPTEDQPRRADVHRVVAAGQPGAEAADDPDDKGARKSVVSGKSVSVRVNTGGRGSRKKK